MIFFQAASYFVIRFNVVAGEDDYVGQHQPMAGG
jgi:hypothetical protein